MLDGLIDGYGADGGRRDICSMSGPKTWIYETPMCLRGWEMAKVQMDIVQRGLVQIVLEVEKRGGISNHRIALIKQCFGKKNVTRKRKKN